MAPRRYIINNRLTTLIPMHALCPHLRTTRTECNEGCYLPYTGSGPYQCRNRFACPGHESVFDAVCYGGPVAVLLRWDREASRGGVGSDWVRETGREGIQYVLDREVSDGQADALAEMLRRSALDHTFTEQARRYTSASTQGDGEREQQQQDEQQLLRLALEASTRLQSRSEPDLDFALALRRSLLDAHPASNRNEDDPAFLRALHDSELESHGNGGAGGTSTTHSGLSIAAMGARARQLALERGEDADTSAIESQVRGRGFRGHGSRSGGEETIASTTVPSISTATSMATSTATPEATPESQTAEGSRNTTNVTSQRGKRRKRKSRRRDNEQRPAPTSSSVDVDAYDEVPKDEPPGYTMVADPGRGEKHLAGQNEGDNLDSRGRRICMNPRCLHTCYCPKP